MKDIIKVQIWTVTNYDLLIFLFFKLSFMTDIALFLVQTNWTYQLALSRTQQNTECQFDVLTTAQQLAHLTFGLHVMASQVMMHGDYYSDAPAYPNLVYMYR